MGPQNGIMGNGDFLNLPHTQLQEEDLEPERRMVKFSKAKEFKVLREHIERRLAFYQGFLPDGRALTDVDTAERGNQWVIANAVIGELKGLLEAYEAAEETLRARRTNA